MSFSERYDFLLEEIRRLSQAIVQLTTGAQISDHYADKRDDSETTNENIGRQLNDLLESDFHHSQIETLDAKSIRMILRSDERFRLYSQALRLKAQLLRTQGQNATANQIEDRLQELGAD